MTQIIVITSDGTAHCVYGEQIALRAIGELEIRRASHVEPDGQGRWWADLSPVEGPILGPYPDRSDAIAAEGRWLCQHWLVGRRC